MYALCKTDYFIPVQLSSMSPVFHYNPVPASLRKCQSYMPLSMEIDIDHCTTVDKTPVLLGSSAAVDQVAL